MEVVIKTIILGYFICLGLTGLFILYIKRKIGESFVGSTYRMIPKKFIPLVVLATIGFLVIVAFSVIYIFDTNFHNTVLPLPFIDLIHIKMVGAVFVIFGFIFLLAGIFRLGTSTRFFLPKKETKLVTDGIYAISRNPVYVGTNTTCVGVLPDSPKSSNLAFINVLLNESAFQN